ncbi:glycerophosphodiester phosphodiesterase family protein [Halobacteriovorax marinus]|nr:glycerophosphodiester phosphodiesterase family protein [Halobacteriovorax marinus]
MMNWLSKTPITHRGFHNNEFPENSLGAFEYAIKNDYAIEFDIRLTKDKKIVVFHDLDTSRVTRTNLLVKNSTLSELEKIKLEESTYTIPSLVDVLKLVNGRVPLLIEIKNEGGVGDLEEELIRILDNYKGQFAIQSFNPLSLKYISDKRENFSIGLLVGSFKKSKISFLKKFLLKNMLLTPILRPDFFSVEYGVDIWSQQTMLKIFSSKQIIYWTIRNESVANDLLTSGKGVIFEGFNIK